MGLVRVLRKTGVGEGGDVDESPVTRYATAPDGVSIAYQVTGDGPLDLVFVRASTFPIDLLWDEPTFLRVARRLGGFSRTVWFEALGMGASGGNFEDRFDDEITDGSHTLKGVVGTWHLYSAEV